MGRLKIPYNSTARGSTEPLSAVERTYKQFLDPLLMSLGGCADKQRTTSQREF